jgi:hypothetical protein
MNKCLHCEILDAIHKWGLEYGEGQDDEGRFASLNETRGALAACIGYAIAQTFPATTLDNAASRVENLQMAYCELAGAIALSDMAAGAAPAAATAEGTSTRH